MSNAINIDQDLLDMIDQMVLIQKEIKELMAEKIDALVEKKDLLKKKIEREM
jgi:hypothetical protein